MNESPTTFTISLDKTEITVLLNLLDVAVKSAGRPACEAVFHFERKLNAAMTPPATLFPPGEIPKV